MSLGRFHSLEERIWPNLPAGQRPPTGTDRGPAVPLLGIVVAAQRKTCLSFSYTPTLRVRHTGSGFLQLSGELSSLPDPTPIQLQILVIHLNPVAIRVVEVHAHREGVPPDPLDIYPFLLEMAVHLLQVVEGFHLPGKVVGANPGLIWSRGLGAHRPNGQFVGVLSHAQEGNVPPPMVDFQAQHLSV